MDHVITTIYFDGQFWVALIAKTETCGKLFLGKYTFGPEPSNPEIIDFYLNKYPRIKLFEADRLEKSVSMPLKHEQRFFSKSKVCYNFLLSKEKENSRKLQKQREKSSLIEKFQKASDKKKKRKRGK